MRRGFTRTEAAIVLGSIAVVAAIAIAWLSASRGNAYDAAAASNMHAYAKAQTMYIKTDWDGDNQKKYATPFTNLYMDATAANKMHKLIDKGFYDATVATALKQGFYFGDLTQVATVAINWAADYGLCGAPGSYGRSGTKVFVIQVDGRPTSTDAENLQVGVLDGQVVNLIADYPGAAQMLAQKWIEAE